MDLNTRIDFIIEKNITDEDGFDISTKEVVYSCWANRKVLSASYNRRAVFPCGIYGSRGKDGKYYYNFHWQE